jgi:hypothetical protein
VSENNKNTLTLKVCTDRNLWNDFVSFSPQGNLFCQTNYLDLFQKNYELLSVCKGDEILLGAVVVKGEGGQPTSTPFMYQWLLFNSTVEGLATHKQVKKSLELVGFYLWKLKNDTNEYVFPCTLHSLI